MTLAGRSYCNDDEADFRVVSFTEREIAEAGRLMARIAGAADADPGRSLPFSRSQEDGRNTASLDRGRLVAKAGRALAERRLRNQFFNRAIFGETVWDMLLVLYVADFAAERLTIGKLAGQIKAPLSTVLRWLAYLERDRLAGRVAHPHDRRMIFVQLLDRGRSAFDAYFASLRD